jgi:hypothetical protein
MNKHDANEQGMKLIKSESFDPIHEVVPGEDLILGVDDAIQVLLLDILLYRGVLDHPVDHKHLFHGKALLHQLSLRQRLFNQSLGRYLPTQRVHRNFLTVLLVILLYHCLVFFDAWVVLLAEVALNVHQSVLL